MRSAAEGAIRMLLKVLGANDRLNAVFQLSVERERRNSFSTISYNGQTIYIANTSPVPRIRAASFATKEPMTLEWIDSFDPQDILWDIGANIGVYSIYAAKRHPGLKVFAFEPSVFNLLDLASNVGRNGLADVVTIVPLAATDRSGAAMLNMSNTMIGGALSSFGQNYGHDGRELDISFRYKTIGIALDDAENAFNLALPTHIKIDVDGIEHLIISGAAKLLRNPGLKSLLVETNGKFEAQMVAISAAMERAGFVLKDREKHRTATDDDLQNQIWKKETYVTAMTTRESA